MREGRRMFALLVALALAVAACTPTGQGKVAPPPPTTTSTVAAATTTTIDQTKAAILTAYRASWADYIAVAETYPVKPLDPRIADHDTGNELLSDRQSLTHLSVLGHVNVGPTDLSPVVTSLTGTAAIVTDCIFDHSYEIDANTKTPVEAPDVGHSLYKFTMSLVGEAWFVSNSTRLISGKTEDACVPGAA